MDGLKNSADRGFTLIEMLAVLAIIGLMIGISVPIFNIVGSSRGVRSDMLRLNSTLRLARQHAVMKRAHAYVVIVDHFPADPAISPLPEHSHRAYAVMEGDNVAPTNYVSPWHLLSQGIYFASVTATTWTASTTGTDLMDMEIPNANDRRVAAPYPDSASGLNPRMIMIQYAPDGRCRQYNGTAWDLTSQIHIMLVPGVLSNPNAPPTFSPENRVRAGNVFIASRTGLGSLRLDPD